MNASRPHPSERSQRGLDWLNFFIADVETGFGPFIILYLALNGWQQGQIGLALTVGSIAGIASQLLGGTIIDAVHSKQTVVGVELAMTTGGGLLLFFSHALWLVLLAPAISLGLVGHRGLSERLGRNHRFDSYGNAGTTGLMGLLGHYVAKRFSFLFAAGLCLPALWALVRIRSSEINYARARAAKPGETDRHPAPTRTC